VDAALEAVRRQPELYPLKHGRARQVVVRRFPFMYLLHPSWGPEHRGDRVFPQSQAPRLVEVARV